MKALGFKQVHREDRMNIWIVCMGEHLSIDDGGQRQMRAAMLTQALIANGHKVTRWASTFSHFTKRHRCDSSGLTADSEGERLWLLHGISYVRHVGIRRLINHMQLAHEFRRLSATEPAPDIIFCCWPVLEVGYAAADYAERHSVPILLDVRDLWPDIFLGAVPKALRPLARLCLAPYERMARSAFRRASGVVGISQGYLDWGLLKAGRARTANDAVFSLGYREPDWANASVDEGKATLRKLGVDDSLTICWFLGSFGDTYDLAPVILAARQLQERGEDRPQFVFSGEGRGRAEYERLAAGLGNVVFTGWIDASQIASMMCMAKIAIAAYCSGAPQGLPNKIFEYMAAGLAILSSLDGECKQFLEDNACGLYYPAAGADGFLAALLPQLEEPGLAERLGGNGRKAFLERYAEPIVYSRLTTHIESILAAS